MAGAARVLSTASAINRTLSAAGFGVAMAFDIYVLDALARGELVRVLERFCAAFPGHCLYYPQRRHACPRRARSSTTRGAPVRGRRAAGCRTRGRQWGIR